MTLDEFNRIRDEYIKARSDERATLIDYLKSDGYNVKTKGNAGSGREDYTGRGKLNPPHDLRHHKWIEADKGVLQIKVKP